MKTAVFDISSLTPNDRIKVYIIATLYFIGAVILFFVPDHGNNYKNIAAVVLIILSALVLRLGPTNDKVIIASYVVCGYLFLSIAGIILAGPIGLLFSSSPEWALSKMITIALGSALSFICVGSGVFQHFRLGRRMKLAKR